MEAQISMGVHGFSLSDTLYQFEIMEDSCSTSSIMHRGSR